MVIFYILAILGLIGDVIAIWLALHSLKHEKNNTRDLKQILEELHAAVVDKN